MLRNRPGLCFSFLAGFLIAALGGCKGDKCEELVARAQINVVLEGVAAENAASSEVTLTINGSLQVTHSFDKAAPSFVFKFEEYDQPPRTLAINVTVSDNAGNVLGAGQLETSFSSDGCNFFNVSVKPGEQLDGATDAGVFDGPIVDVAGPDGEAEDGPTPDLPSDDITADLPPPDSTADSAPFCGDGTRNGTEECEGTQMGGATCMSLGYDSGQLQCTSSCTYDPSTCHKCGDFKASGPEECDGSDLLSESCQSQGFEDGNLACQNNCTLDLSGCYKCGDNKINGPTEVCDGANLGGQSCTSKNYDGGQLACTAQCAFDATDCYKILDPSGIPIFSATNYQVDPIIAFDGSNYLIVWSDYRSGTNWDIYGVRVDQNGTVLDPTEIVISTETGDQRVHSISFDGTNHLVVWSDRRSTTNWDIYAARVSQGGSVIDGSGIVISTQTNTSTDSLEPYPSVSFDGTNYLVVWDDYRSGTNWDIYGAQVSQAGSVLTPSGIAISTAPSYKWNPKVSFDGTNHLVLWMDDRGGSDWDVYGVRVDKGGNVLDTSDIAISTATGEQNDPTLACDGTTCLVVWGDYRSGAFWEIYGARVDDTGSVLDPTGFTISTGNANWKASVAFDGTNYLVVWDDNRSGTSIDIYGARVTTSSSLIDNSGIAISTAADDQRNPSVACSGAACLVVWQDNRVSSIDIYGAQIETSGNP